MTDYDITIDWYHGYANSPSATIVVPQTTFNYYGFDNEVWHQTPDHNYCYATHDNVLYHFIAARNTGIMPRSAMMGFGGHHFNLHCVNGTTVVTNNAWSGNAEDFNRSAQLPYALRDVSILSADNPSASPWAGFAIRTAMLRALVERAGYHMTPSGAISVHPTEPVKPEGRREYPGTMKSHFGGAS